METEASLVNRRQHKRSAVILPVELRVYSATSLEPLSEPMHGVLSDASLGGLCVHLVGPAASLFLHHNWSHACVELKLLTPSYRDVSAVMGTIRWSRSVPGGCDVGLQLVDSKTVDVPRLIQRLIRTAEGRRSAALRRPTIAALAVAIVATVWASAAVTERASLAERLGRVTSQLEAATAHEERLSRVVQASDVELQRLREAQVRCALPARGPVADPQEAEARTAGFTPTAAQAADP
ncbi:MAG TPA: PilZ domain-containing protein, partial [Myxococcota bacterium]|nr:PilZ domain-containing protein [Myxococcota bacterium]